MKIRALLYHDVIPNGAASDYSGFRGASASAYKLSFSQFQAHLAHVGKAATNAASVGSTIDHILAESSGHKGAPCAHIIFTFDDGGISALTQSARLVESYGWRGHYFIATDQIDKPGFLSAVQIRELDRQGHVIGSHSCTHPRRMADLSMRELLIEWRQSLATLSEILGRNVDIASVPGGLYSKRVGLAARDAGVRILFTSEPKQRLEEIAEMKLVGRYSVVRSDTPEYAYRIAAGAKLTLEMQWLFWNLKKIAKRCAGRQYLLARELYFRRKV